MHHQLFLRFDKGMEKMREYINNTKKHIYLVGVLQASKVISFISLRLSLSLSLDLIINLLFINYILTSLQDYCSRLGLKTANWTLDDAFEYFFNKANRYETPSNASKREENSVKIYDKYSPRIAEKLNELKDNPNVDDERANDINNSGKLIDSKGVKENSKRILYSFFRSRRFAVGDKRKNLVRIVVPKVSSSFQR